MEKRSGWLVKFCFVGARKCGVILKAACKAGLRDRHPIQDQSAGKQKPAVGDIISDGISGFRFEKAHHIIFAQINPGREKIYVQSLRQMLVDILDQIDDLRIVQTGVQKLYPIFNGSPVEVDHKFQK